MERFSRIPVATVAVVAMLLLSSVGSVAAQSSQPDWAGDLETAVDEMIPAYNERAGDVDLGPFSLAGTTNVYVHDGNVTATYHITMDGDNRITAFEAGTSDDAARKLTTDRATLERIANASNPAGAFRTAIAEDDIVITGESGHVVEGLKWTVVNALKGLFL